MSQVPKDSKDETAPKPAPVPEAPNASDRELSDEELGKVSGGMAQIQGTGRTSIKSDLV